MLPVKALCSVFEYFILYVTQVIALQCGEGNGDQNRKYLKQHWKASQELKKKKNKDPNYKIFISILLWKKVFKVCRSITEDVLILGHELS